MDFNKARDEALKKMFPRRADPALPRSLPLSKYAGTYFNPGYQNLTIQEQRPELPGKRSEKAKLNNKEELWAPQGLNVVWETTYGFEHISGEYWFVNIAFDHGRNGLMEMFGRAEFVVGPGGTADAVEIEYSEGGFEGRIRYERVA